jgi:phosphoribosylformylglycinamidine cyclo-ligase
VVPEHVAAIVEGVAEGCRRAGCALLGGETAEHPGIMAEDQFDLAGFCVGLVDGSDVLGPDRVREGDRILGIASSGLHANGYSLVRTTLLDRYPLVEAPPGLGRSLADELLEPCEIYAPTVLGLARDGLVHAAAHITGGGFHENVPRALPPGLGARIERGAWREPPIFGLVQEAAGASDDDMFATFNMGVGMVLVADAVHAEEILRRSAGRAFALGEVVAGTGVAIVPA